MDNLFCEAVTRAELGEPLKRMGEELLWRCPHGERHKNGDAHPSLKINPKKNVFLDGPCGASGGAWKLAAFFAGASVGDKPTITAWLSEHGLWGGANCKPKARGRGPCVATYIYMGANGQPVARKLRFEPGAHGEKKDFELQRFEGGQWRAGLGGLKLPLYRLTYIKTYDFVVLTEGEKDADAGAAIGLPTATSGGVNSWREDHALALAGKAVCIIADADGPGREHAQKVAASLDAHGVPPVVVELPGVKDLAEFIESGGTVEQVWAFIDAAPEWKPATGAELLDSVMRFTRRFVSLTESQARAVALWVPHTHALRAADCTPYLTINSPEKQSGKTRLLEVLETLVANPWLTGRVTAAVLIRKIDARSPTLLLDESDAAFKGDPTYAQALRAILDAGYRRGGKASCCVGQGANISFKDFSTFCPKAIAGIGRLPDTLADRSIPVQLKRARRGEVHRFREREVILEVGELRARIAAWCAANLERLRTARPAIPCALSDRQADTCEPLFAIADLAGGDWPEGARAALIELSAKAQAGDESIGVRMLSDVRVVFVEGKVTEMLSRELADALAKIETSPWGEWSNGRPISPARLARLLKPYDIHPGQIQNGLARGYRLDQFKEAFSLYLPLTPPLKVSKCQKPTKIAAPMRFSKCQTKVRMTLSKMWFRPIKTHLSDTLTL